MTQICFALGATLLLFPFAIFALDCLTLAVGGSIAAWQAWVGLVISCGLCFQQNSNRKQALIVLAIALGVIGLSLWVSGSIYDFSWDGQNYHQEAILQLSAGWNPFYRYLDQSLDHSIWLNHYAKASWMIQSSLYQMTQHLETAKAINWILLVASFCLTVAALRETIPLPKGWIIAIASLLALNPVVIVQLSSFTIDGLLASLLLILGVLLYWIGSGGTFMPLFWLAAASAILLINLKFTSLVYAIIFIFGLLVWLFFRDRKVFYQASIGFLFCLFIGVAGAGFNPYITNILKQGNPFYPLRGNENVDIIAPQIPKNFIGLNPIEKLLFSVFAESDDARNTTAQLKIPFSVKLREIGEVSSARVGGFGVLFSGAVCLSLIVVCFRKWKPFQLTTVALGTILASTLINPEAWWARYAPQVWFFMPMAIAPGWIVQKPALNRKVLRFSSYALALVLSINCASIVAPEIFQSIRGAITVNQQINKLKQSGITQVSVQYNLFRGNRTRFLEHGITWTEVNRNQKLPCKNPTQFYRSRTLFCPISKV
ncbi:hypothetical protein IQ250_02535 [Pseudanabaenaceae cyanobacterium LEGE 13415]|nr:hypothetical protein [Pseudanabaenaceae cyanobacterium LEGE 13415]